MFQVNRMRDSDTEYFLTYGILLLPTVLKGIEVIGIMDDSGARTLVLL